MAARGTLVFAVSALMLVLTSRRADADTDDERRALVVLRILAYDRNLGKRAGDTVTIVVAAPATADGDAERARWLRAFESLGKIKVDGRRLVIAGHRVADAKKLDRELADAKAAAVLLCDGAIAIADLTPITRARKTLSIATREADVHAGVAVGVIRGTKRDEIVVNIAGATAEGVKFDAGLLQLARKVEGQR